MAGGLAKALAGNFEIDLKQRTQLHTKQRRQARLLELASVASSLLRKTIQHFSASLFHTENIQLKRSESAAAAAATRSNSALEAS